MRVGQKLRARRRIVAHVLPAVGIARRPLSDVAVAPLGRVPLPSRRSIGGAIVRGSNLRRLMRVARRLHALRRRVPRGEMRRAQFLPLT